MPGAGVPVDPSQGNAPGRLAFEFGQKKSSRRRRVITRKGVQLLLEVLEAQVNTREITVLPEELPDLLHVHRTRSPDEDSPVSGSGVGVRFHYFGL